MRPQTKVAAATLEYLFIMDAAFNSKDQLKNIPPEQRENTLNILRIIKAFLRGEKKDGHPVANLYTGDKDVSSLRESLSTPRKKNLVASLAKKVGETFNTRSGYVDFRNNVNDTLAPVKSFLKDELGQFKLQTMLKDSERLNNIHQASMSTRLKALEVIEKEVFIPAHDGAIRADLGRLQEARDELKKIKTDGDEQNFVDALESQLDAIIDLIGEGTLGVPTQESDRAIVQRFDGFRELCQFELGLARFCQQFNLKHL